MGNNKETKKTIRKTKKQLECRSHGFSDNLEHIRHVNVGNHLFSTYAKIFREAKVTSDTHTYVSMIPVTSIVVTK